MCSNSARFIMFLLGPSFKPYSQTLLLGIYEYFPSFAGWQEDPFWQEDQSLEMVLEKRVARLKYSRATGPRLSSCRATFLSQVSTPCFSAQ